MLIIGAGECGARAALTLRERGYDGPVTLVGHEPHLPYERPPLSKDSMVTEAEPLPKLVCDRQFFVDRQIDCRTGTRAISINVADMTACLSYARDEQPLSAWGAARAILCRPAGVDPLPLLLGLRRR